MTGVMRWHGSPAYRDKQPAQCGSLVWVEATGVCPFWGGSHHAGSIYHAWNRICWWHWFCGNEGDSWQFCFHQQLDALWLTVGKDDWIACCMMFSLSSNPCWAPRQVMVALSGFPVGSPLWLCVVEAGWELLRSQFCASIERQSVVFFSLVYYICDWYVKVIIHSYLTNLSTPCDKCHGNTSPSVPWVYRTAWLFTGFIQAL